MAADDDADVDNDVMQRCRADVWAEWRHMVVYMTSKSQINQAPIMTKQVSNRKHDKHINGKYVSNTNVYHC